jgi:hypothetical protein
MAVVAITGGAGAPGATSAALALLLSWPLAERRRVLLLECDPDGGAVLAGALQGQLETNASLRNLALADRRGRLLEVMWEQCLDVSAQGTGDRLLLPGLTDPAQAASLGYTWAPLAHACQSLDTYGCDVIVDLGRSGAYGPSAVLARQADAVLAVLRTTLRGLSSARPRINALAADLAAQGSGADALGLLLVQEGPYSASEISRALNAPVVGLLPHAPREAWTLSDGGRADDRRFLRSELMRAARSTADELRALIARRRVRVLAPQQPEPRPDWCAPQPPGGAVPGGPGRLHAVPGSGPAPRQHGAWTSDAPSAAPVGLPTAGSAGAPPRPNPPQPGPVPQGAAAGYAGHGAQSPLRPVWPVPDTSAFAARSAGPVTPDQAARLQAVHTEPSAAGPTGHPAHPQPQVQPRPSYRPATAPMPGPGPAGCDADRGWFTPLHAAPPPPLADHAPRPPAPRTFRPTPQPDPMAPQAQSTPQAEPPQSGEVARVR